MKHGMGEPERTPWAPWKWGLTQPMQGGHHFVPTGKSLFFPSSQVDQAKLIELMMLSSVLSLIMLPGIILKVIVGFSVGGGGASIFVGMILVIFLGQPAWHIWAHQRKGRIVASASGLQLYALPLDHQILEWSQVAWREGPNGVIYLRLKQLWLALELKDYPMGALLRQIIQHHCPEAPLPFGPLRIWAPASVGISPAETREESLELVNTSLLKDGQSINLAKPISEARIAASGSLTLTQGDSTIIVVRSDPRLPHILAQPQVAASLQRSPAQTSASDPITKLLNRLRLGGRKGE